VRDPAYPDVSQVPAVLCPNPDYSAVPVSRRRVFEFGRDAEQTTFDPITSFFGPWGIRNGSGAMLAADFGRISAAPKLGTREIWTLKNGGGGWDHPVHIHFEEGHILARDGAPATSRSGSAAGRTSTVSAPAGRSGSRFSSGTSGHVHAALPQHHARGQRHAHAVGDRRQGRRGPGATPTPIPTPQGVRFQAPGEVLPDA